MKKVLLPLLLLVVLQPLQARESVNITSEPGVPVEATVSTQKAIDALLKIGLNQAGFTFQRNVRILLVKDDPGYEAALIRELGVTPEEARRRVQTTKAWSARDLIIQNVGGLPKVKQRIFNMGHEVFHQFQTQLAGGKSNQVMWLMEGSADAMGTMVVEECQQGSFDGYQQDWLSIILKADQLPLLSSLYEKDSWYDALKRYQNNVAYRVSGVACQMLIQKQGVKPMFNYFAELKSSKPEAAFKSAFGLNMKDYEAAYSVQLDEVRRGR